MTKIQSLLLAVLFTAGPAFAQTEPVASIESSTPDPAQAIAPKDLPAALRKGGYVLYFRHTATDFSKNDAAMTSYTDCANQRLLSPEGRRSAQDIGRRIRALKLPVGEVFASPYCRTMDTATLMLTRATPKNEIREGAAGDYPGLKALLATPVAAGTNRWLIGHGIPFRAVAGAPHLAEGEAAVIKPEGTRWTVVARVLPGDWAALR